MAVGYWEDEEGYWYNEADNGDWQSGQPDGSQCVGDKAGNWSCSDGQTGGPEVKPPGRRPPTKNSDLLIFGAIGLLLVLLVSKK